MTRAARFWPAGLLVVVAGAVWLLSSLPVPLRSLAVTSLVAIVVATLWFALGGRVVGFLVWLIPLSIATVALLQWPSVITAGLHTTILALPFLGWVFAPIRQAYSSVSLPIEGWLLHHSLSGDDQRTHERLLNAIRGTPQLREDSRQLDDLPRALHAMRRHTDEILGVEAPDLGWKQAIQGVAAPRVLYQEMLAGERALDYDLAEEAVRAADRGLRDFLRSRSLFYRILSHRFVEPEVRRGDE